MLLQRTTNNKTTESYRYDADGNLTGAEADVSTWEERNTEIYSWINDVAPPPLDVHRRPLPLALQPPRSRPAPSRSADDPRLVRMASAVHRVPALAWSGLTASVFIYCRNAVHANRDNVYYSTQRCSSLSSHQSYVPFYCQK